MVAMLCILPSDTYIYVYLPGRGHLLLVKLSITAQASFILGRDQT